MQSQKYYGLGIDIGGTNTKIGIVDMEGNIYGYRSFPTRANRDNLKPFLNILSKNVRLTLEKTPGSLLGIGISTHGYIDTERHGPIVCQNTPALKGFNLRGWAEGTFKLKTLVMNDLIAHALAEYYFGSGRGSRRFMCMVVGTGFGIGVIDNGKPLILVGGTTGDAGRLILEPGGPKCNYGVSGSVEALVGVANIEQMALERYGHRVTAFQVISAAREGNDEIASEIIEIIGSYLGFALASLSAIFLPEKVALTGGTAEAGEILLNACQDRFKELTGDYHQLIHKESKELYKGVEIVLGENRGESGLIGAVADLFQRNSVS